MPHTGKHKPHTHTHAYRGREGHRQLNARHRLVEDDHDKVEGHRDGRRQQPTASTLTPAGSGSPASVSVPPSESPK